MAKKPKMPTVGKLGQRCRCGSWGDCDDLCDWCYERAKKPAKAKEPQP